MAVLAGFAYWGAKKGLIKAMTGVVVVSIALFGAGYAASALSGPAAKVIAPAIEKRVEAKVEEAIREQLPGQMPSAALPLNDLLNLLGLDEAMQESLGRQARETIRETGVSAATAVVENVAQSILYRLLYAVSFAVITAVLHGLVRGLKLVFRLPGLRGLNKVGGGLLGLLEGLLVLFVAAWVLRILGASFAAESCAVRLLTERWSLDSLIAFLPLTGMGGLGVRK